MKSKNSRSKFNFSGEARGNLLSRYAAEESYEEKVQRYDDEVEAAVKKPKNKKFFWLLIILLAVLVLLGIFAGILYLLPAIKKGPKLISAKTSSEHYDSSFEIVPEPTELPYSYLSKPTLSTINAKSVFVYSPELSETFAAKNIDKKYRVASITKLMTAYSALDVFDEEKELCVLEETRLYGSIDLKRDDCFARNDLLIHMLSSSSNDAAKQFELNATKSGFDFINYMNLNASKLRLDNTHYENTLGLDDVQNYSTSKDSVQLLHALIQDVDEGAFLGTKSNEIVAKNTGTKYPYVTTNALFETRKDIIGGKTGFTSEAGGTLIVIVKKPSWDFTIYAVILGVEDEDARFEEMSKLLDLVYRRYKI